MFWDKDRIEAKQAVCKCQDLMLRVLQEYRSNHTPDEIESDQSILGHLVKTPYPSESARTAEMITYLFGGHDTTAYSLSWTLIEVARHAEVYQAIRSEIAAAVPAGSSRVSHNQACELKYLDQVIKESMRFWPVTAMGSLRIAQHDIELQGYTLPKGSTIILPFYPIFRYGIEVEYSAHNSYVRILYRLLIPTHL
jgi:cytochrome P450